MYHKSKPLLLIKKEPFLKYLEGNGLRIVWTVLGEKLVISGRTFESDSIGRLQISGAFYLDKDKIEGRVNTKNT